MKYTIKPQNAGTLFWFRVFLDPFLAMLFLGILGHRLGMYHGLSQFLFHMSYWNVWLINATLQALWPSSSPSMFDIEEKKEK